MRARIYILLLLAPCAWSYATGAGSCISPEAGHGPAVNHSGGYALSAPTRMAAGSYANLTLQGVQDFKGVLLSTGAGGFAELPAGLRPLACVGDSSSSVTHTGNGWKQAPLQLRLDAPSVPQRFRVHGSVVRRNVLGGSALAGVVLRRSEWYEVSCEVVAAERHTVDGNLSIAWFWEREEEADEAGGAANRTAGWLLTLEIELAYAGWVAVGLGRAGQAAVPATQAAAAAAEADPAPFDIVFGTPFADSTALGRRGSAVSDCHALANEPGSSVAPGTAGPPPPPLLLRLDAAQSLRRPRISSSNTGTDGTGAGGSVGQQRTRMSFSRRADDRSDAAFDATIGDAAATAPTRLTFWYGAPRARGGVGSANRLLLDSAAAARTLDVHFRRPPVAPSAPAPGGTMHGGAGSPLAAAAGGKHVTLASGVALSWVRDDALGSITFELTASGRGGAPLWLSLGFSADGTMVGSVAVAAVRGGGGGGGAIAVGEYRLGGKVAPADAVLLPAHGCISGRAASVGAASGVHTLRFSHSFRAAEPLPALRRAGPTHVIWAVGTDGGSGALGYHDGGHGAKVIDFATGATRDVRMSALLAMHVACMWLGFLVLLPAAVVATQLKGRCEAWFFWHRALATAALGCCALGTLLVVLEVDRKQGAHLLAAHSPLHPSTGLATIVALAIQVGTGLARPPKSGSSAKSARVGAFSPRPAAAAAAAAAPPTTVVAVVAAVSRNKTRSSVCLPVRTVRRTMLGGLKG